jgi:hypothetical protein
MDILKQLTEYFENKSKPFLIMVNIALLLCIGLVAYVTGYEMSLFYLIPISFAAWFGGRPRSIIISSLSVLTIATTDFMAGKKYPYFFVELWNLLMYLGFFAVYAVVLSLVKADLDERKMLLEEIQKALSEVKLLSGLLPICASCKKIRDDKGYWKRIETYISAHSEAQFTHGICPECAKRLYPKDYDDIFGKKEGKQ